LKQKALELFLLNLLQNNIYFKNHLEFNFAIVLKMKTKEALEHLFLKPKNVHYIKKHYEKTYAKKSNEVHNKIKRS
jgi:hypothetical protein